MPEIPSEAAPVLIRCRASWMTEVQGQPVELRCSRQYLDIDGRHPGNHLDVNYYWMEWAE